MPSNVVSLTAERRAREEANKPHVLMVETVISPNSTIAVGALIAVGTKGMPNVMFCRWLGSTGRDIRGRFAKRGSPFELFQLDNGLRYYTQQVQLGVVQILGVVFGAHLAGKPRPHTAA